MLHILAVFLCIVEFLNYFLYWNVLSCSFWKLDFIFFHKFLSLIGIHGHPFFCDSVHVSPPSFDLSYLFLLFILNLLFAKLRNKWYFVPTHTIFEIDCLVCVWKFKPRKLLIHIFLILVRIVIIHKSRTCFIIWLFWKTLQFIKRHIVFPWWKLLHWEIRIEVWPLQ